MTSSHRVFFSSSQKFIINGQEYDSLDDVPERLRKLVEGFDPIGWPDLSSRMEELPPSTGGQRLEVVKVDGRTIYRVGDQEFTRLEDVPPPFRALLTDSDGDGLPDVMEGLEAFRKRFSSDPLQAARQRFQADELDADVIDVEPVITAELATAAVGASQSPPSMSAPSAEDRPDEDADVLSRDDRFDGGRRPNEVLQVGMLGMLLLLTIGAGALAVAAWFQG